MEYTKENISLSEIALLQSQIIFSTAISFQKSDVILKKKSLNECKKNDAALPSGIASADQLMVRGQSIFLLSCLYYLRCCDIFPYITVR